MKFSTLKYYLKVLLTYDLDGVFDTIRNSLSIDSNFLNIFLVQLASYNSLKEEIKLNVIERAPKNIELNKVRVSMLQLLDDLNKEDIIDYGNIFDLIETNNFINPINKKDRLESITSDSDFIPDPRRSDKDRPYFSLEGFMAPDIKLLSFFYANQTLNEHNLNKLIAGINLMEEILNINISNINSFQNGEILTNNDLNRLVKPINSLREKLKLKPEWKFFPTKRGDKITAELMNELVNNLNQVINLTLNNKQ